MFNCRHCGEKFSYKSKLTKHLEKKNLCERTVESYKYKNEDLYKLSLERIYNTEKTHLCKNCNKNFYNNANLKRHIEKYCKTNVLKWKDTKTRFTEEQYNKYLLALKEYKIFYLISNDCLIDTNEKKIFTTDIRKYFLYQTNIPLLTKPSKFDEIILDYELVFVDNLEKKL